MANEWLTLSQAAHQLGVSARTVRRWIHDGKLRAELRPGPYGQQYLVPINALPAVRVFPTAEPSVPDALAGLRTELLERLDSLEQRQNALLEELVEEVVRLRADVQRLTDRLEAKDNAR